MSKVTAISSPSTMQNKLDTQDPASMECMQINLDVYWKSGDDKCARLSRLFQQVVEEDLRQETDTINATEWVIYQNGNFVFNHSNSQWYYWESTHWQRDEMKFVQESVKKFGDWLWSETLGAHYEVDSALLKRMMKKIIKINDIMEIKYCLEAASSIDKISRTEKDFDANPHLLNFNNGTYDLNVHEFREHRKEDMISKVLDFAYDPAAIEKPNHDKFMQQIFQGDSQLISYVYEYLGMCLSGVVTEQIFQLWHGDGQNGKSVLADHIREMLSTYSRTVNMNILQDNRSTDRAQQEKSRLKGVRFAISSEIVEGKYLNEQLIKDITSNDVITARELYGKSFEFKPSHHLIMFGNHKPLISGNDFGIWRRIHIVPFGYMVPDEDKIPAEELIARFRPEYPAILNTLIESYKVTQANNGKFTKIPDTVISHTKEYQEEMDIIGNWIKECCQLVDGLNSTGKQLYQSYTEWSPTNSLGHLNKAAFTRKLYSHINTKHLHVVIKEGHAREKNYQGIGVIVTDVDCYEN